jgi:endonuclease G, mitochondrial
MRKIVLAFLHFLFLTATLQAQQSATTEYGKKVILYTDGTWVYADSTTSAGTVSYHKLELPAVPAGEQVVHHLGYTLSYNENHEQARWVAYVLTRQETLSAFERSNSFLPDPLVTTGTSGDLDYKGMGYDRGHLAPAADMGWSATAMQESFYYSNMSPQLPGFNRGVWKRLEELVRYWADQYDSVFIVTGPVLTAALPAIGPNNVSVPKYYYKAVLKHGPEGIEGVGFVLPNASSSASLESFSVSIDSVEALTGLDLFPALPDEVEDGIEREVHPGLWQWSRSGITLYSGHKESTVSPDPVNGKAGQSTYEQAPAKRSVSVQCSGTTQAGARCRNKTLSPNGRCWRHGGD